MPITQQKLGKGSATVLEGDFRSGLNPVLEPALWCLEKSNSRANSRATMRGPNDRTVSETDPIPIQEAAAAFHFYYSSGHFDLV